jgi:hypothetical protein
MRTSNPVIFFTLPCSNADGTGSQPAFSTTTVTRLSQGMRQKSKSTASITTHTRLMVTRQASQAMAGSGQTVHFTCSLFDLESSSLLQSQEFL